MIAAQERGDHEAVAAMAAAGARTREKNRKAAEELEARSQEEDEMYELFKRDGDQPERPLEDPESETEH
jgi:hypothetical protein